MSVPAAQFVNVTQTFGDVVAVDDISLDIERGKLTTLLGPSGCGKTTSLRMLAGFGKPTSGQIFIEGEECTRVPPEKRGLGMVFQQYALFPHMTVRDNVGYGLKLRKVPTAERRQRVDEALELVGLTSQADKRPRQMSGGQQQRVALARAIAIRPRLLLLDEPLSALDARLRVEMRAELRRIQAETGLCVVLVTHDQDEALELSDQMVVMRAGKIEQAGTPQAVFSAPASRFVAEFLGYENFLTLADGQHAAVRPERLVVGTPDDTPSDGALRLDGTVADVAYRGVDLLVTSEVTDPAGQQVRLVADIRGATAGAFAPGQPVRLSITPDHLIVLAA
ncbi:ABC transporter ATP-binding protein [Micropruina sp.]|jgi:ABC-type Fe3+/spermidine/putrescine transport system ATPase subunit|uniref:ABC transporter ATP-binding protein n=1 Tax=Micropruina sp. TaxID=2737536 RepID=UPI002627E7FE|nr:ABC transporter ATP-binding protein [Micropruina sp.]